MNCPTVELQGKKIILLSGVRKNKKTGETIGLEAPDKLRDIVRENPDAVAFGYTSGRWVAAA